jgi:hypothetical protein
MKIVKNLFIVAFAIALSACTSPKNVDKVSDKKDTVAKPFLADSLSRFVVSFYSIGTGVNGIAKEKFDAFILKFNKDNGVILAVQSTNWGREGEVDLCFKLRELTAAQEVDFITKSKALLQNDEHINFEEMVQCKNWKR